MLSFVNKVLVNASAHPPMKIEPFDDFADKRYVGVVDVVRVHWGQKITQCSHVTIRFCVQTCFSNRRKTFVCIHSIEGGRGCFQVRGRSRIGRVWFWNFITPERRFATVGNFAFYIIFSPSNPLHRDSFSIDLFRWGPPLFQTPYFFRAAVIFNLRSVVLSIRIHTVLTRFQLITPYLYTHTHMPTYIWALAAATARKHPEINSLRRGKRKKTYK